MKNKYKRVLLKLSGEGLLGDESFGVCPKVVDNLARQIKTVHGMGVDVCIVIGGGNIFRGAKKASETLNRSVADQVGMLATVMNAIYIQSALQHKGIDAEVVSALDIPQVCKRYMYSDTIESLKQRKVIVFAGGTGNPFFTTDTAATLRASEMQCDAVLKATQVDGVYDSDPKINQNAKRYDTVSFDEAISKNLKVMDMTAIALAKENDIPIVVFSQQGENSIVDAIIGKGKFTTIRKEV